jgi:hypothetical protein
VAGAGFPGDRFIAISDQTWQTLVLSGRGGIGQVVIHLGVQCPLCQRLCQLIQQTALVKVRTRLRAWEQLVQQRMVLTSWASVRIRVGKAPDV